jgi:hypothetical protein
MTGAPLRALVATGVLAALLATSCRSSPPVTPKLPPGRSTQPGAPPGSASAAAPRGPAASSLVAHLTGRAVGPQLALGPEGALAAYLSPIEAGSRSLVAIPLDTRGRAREGHVLATIGVDATTLVLRRGGGAKPAFVAAWTALTDRGEAISVLGVGDDGSPRSKPAELGRTAHDIVWVEIVPTPSGSVVLWAEETDRGAADVLAVPLDPSGTPRGVPSHVVRDVGGWQAVAREGGVGLATLAPVAKGQVLRFLRLDADARPIAAPVEIASGAGVGRDMDAVAVPSGVVFAWTDREHADPDVVVAAVDTRGVVTPPRAVATGRGGSSLTALAGGATGALLAWEDPRKRTRGTRRVSTLFVGVDGAADTSGPAFDVLGGTTPELRAVGDGFALLGWSRACAPAQDAAACASATPSPLFVRIGADGKVAQIEPLYVSDMSTPALAWNLDCTATRCAALEATSEKDTRVFAVDLPARPSSFKPLAIPTPPEGAPSIVQLRTFLAGAHVVDLQAAGTGDDGLVASLTIDDSNTDPALLTLNLHPVKAGEVGAAVLVTKRALAMGGVSIAPSPDGGAALAWVAREGNDPVVRVQRVDRLGKRTSETTLASAPGDASDVRIAWDGSGYLVAWVDGRHGDGEVYAARLGADLARGREERITRAPGDATDLTLLVRGDVGWLAWADPRDSLRDGFADIYVARIRTRDAKLASADQRVLASAAHSRSPSFAPVDDGVALAWIEEAPPGADPKTATSYGALLARLDVDGRPRGEPVRIPTAGGGFPTGVLLDPRSAVPRGVVVRASRDELSFDAFVSGAAGTRTFSFLPLDGPPSLDVPMSWLGSALFFGDDGPDAMDRRARRAVVQWRQ